MLRRSLLFAIALLFAFGACGSDGKNDRTETNGSAPAADSPPSEADLREAARAINGAFLKSDTQGSFRYLSAACRKKHGVGGWGVQLALGKGFLESFAGMKASDLAVGEIKTRNVTTTSGEASVDLVVEATGDSFVGEDSTDYSQWIVEGGAWRTTDCEAFGEDSEDDVSLETARAWPAKWCSLDPNTADRAKVRAVMGEPTSDFDSQDQWDAHHFSFTAFYKNDGTVSQLDIGSTDDLTDAEKASITCDETRHDS